MLLDESIGTERAIEILQDSFRFDALHASLAVLVALICGVVLVALWWRVGRDRWYGDTYIIGGPARERTKDPFTRETIPVEFVPPRMPQAGRQVRPAEAALLLKERVRHQDISATIVDLGVRKYLSITELPRSSFRKPDYELRKLRSPTSELLQYEKSLLSAIFGEELDTRRVGDLRGVFESDFARVKYGIYQQAVEEGFFHGFPDEVRQNYALGGAVVAATGLALTALLGQVGAGLLSIPVVFSGVSLILIAKAMPRRTALGHEMYRRVRAFRQYVAFAEVDRARFAEEAGVFDRYLPYAIVFGCTARWARAFGDLAGWYAHGDWYFGRTGLLPLDLTIGISQLLASLKDGRYEPK